MDGKCSKVWKIANYIKVVKWMWTEKESGFIEMDEAQRGIGAS